MQKDIYPPPSSTAFYITKIFFDWFWRGDKICKLHFTSLSHFTLFHLWPRSEEHWTLRSAPPVHGIMGRRFPDGGLLRYRKWVPQQLGDVADRQPTNGSAAQRHGSQSHGFAVRVWSNLCICSPGLVELVKSNLAPDFPLFHESTLQGVKNREAHG